jgi:hypothetical protein
MSVYNHNCLKCQAKETVKVTTSLGEEGLSVFIEPCTSCKQQTTLNEIMDDFKNKLNNHKLVNSSAEQK